MPSAGVLAAVTASSENRTIAGCRPGLGRLTAASPGDTLYIPLEFYNDSGASVSIGPTLAITDIEVFKNGGTAQRATDSGYAILGDTGNFGNRTGFKGISVQLFNTSDDTGFYDASSSYWVAIDNVTVDARTVRFFPAVFEIGYPKVDAVAISDTGINNRLGVILADTDTGLKTVPSVIQAKTDSLTFTVGGVVDANVRSVNDTTVTGAGTSGDPWGP